MVDLGKHGFEVLSAYGVSIFILLALLCVTLLQSAKAKRRLAALEDTD